MLLFSFHSHAISFLGLYETCNWKNKDFTNRIIREAYQYCPLDEKDDLSQCAKYKPSKIPFCQNIYFSGSESALKRAIVRLHTREGKTAPPLKSVNQFLNDVKKHCPTVL